MYVFLTVLFKNEVKLLVATRGALVKFELGGPCLVRKILTF